MATIDIPYREIYKAIVDRFPKSRATNHIKSNKSHDLAIVKSELGKIIYGKDIDSGYNSPRDTEDAKMLLGQLENPVRNV
jgi:hypothetical protein